MAVSRTFDLSPRDRSIVQLVARFKQLSSTQVHQLLFHTSSSHTPGDRALRRLTEQQFLSRVERRIVGGARGGAGVYVYQLGRRGFYQYFDGRYSPWRTVNYHALGIVDCVVMLKQMERDGLLSIAGLSSEPDCWVTVGGAELKPDLFTELSLPRHDNNLNLYWEIDMGSEGQKQLRAKLDRYWRAFRESDGGIPSTLWVAVDAERQKEIRWIISKMPVEAQGQFRVATLDGVPKFFGG